MQYCSQCLIPDTKPYVDFDAAGVCNACRAHARKQTALEGIDWAARQQAFTALIDEVKAQQAPFYDALVPVSGGKDSITQVHSLLEHGLRILAVHIDYGIKTEIGRVNLDVIPNMGANLMIYRPEQRLHRRLIRIGFEDFGDPDLLSHTLLHAYPLHVALRFQIPLVLLGENSAFEYGGTDDLAAQNTMTRAWFDRYAANAGHDARYVSRRYGIPFEQLWMYDFPDALETDPTTRARFLSYYTFWDSERHLRIAQSHGFQALDHPSEGTYRNYVGIDEKINRIHQYFKVLKFGYGRATDHACEDIRNGRLTRKDAKALVRAHDLLPLSDYYVDDFCALIDMSRARFDEIMEAYRNRDVWQRDHRGQWTIPHHLGDALPARAA